MSNIQKTIKYLDLENNQWVVDINANSVDITLNNETSSYEITNIVKIEHDNEYLFLYEPDSKNFYQIKFESNRFVVIDKFTQDGEHIDTIGSYIFGENNVI